jgi:caffeoyl-CoA O-methyltransferase
MKILLIKGCLLFLIIFLMAFSLALADESPAVFHVPRVDGLTVDGSDNDWAVQGFRVEILTSPDGQTLPASDFDVKFRLGWSLQGLYVVATIIDDIAVEHENLSRMWQKDCVEIFVGENVGSSNRYQLVIASGADPKYSKVRNRLYDHRPQNLRIAKLSFESASQLIEGGYMIEAMLPWRNLGMEPKSGMEFAFQFLANDDDGPKEPGSTFRVAWFPGIGSMDPTKMYTLSLAEKPSEPVLLLVDRKIQASQCTITVQGVRELIGEEVVIRSADSIIAQKKLSSNNGRANAIINLDILESIDIWPRISVEISGKSKVFFDELPTLKSILGRYLQVIGGFEAVEKLSTRSCKGRYISDDSPKNIITLESYAKIPDKWAIYFHSHDVTVKNGFNGTVGWRQDADRILRVDGFARSISGWWLNPQGPIQLQRYFPNIVLKKKDKREEHTVYIVESTTAAGVKHMLEFDAETGLLTRIDDRWEFKDYRQVDGIQFPFRMVLNRNRIFVLDEVKHNVAIGEHLFAMPDAGEVFADAFQGIEDPKVLPMLKMKDLTYEHGDMNIPCRDGRFLFDFIIRNGYKRGLEIGTYNGYSTLWLGLAFQRNGGQVITIEIDSVSGQEAARNFQKAGLTNVIDSRINDAFEEIPRIEGEFDFIFIDANKEDYAKFFKLLKDRIAPGGAIVGHNVINYARDMSDFMDALQNDPDFETTIHRTSAEGISVSIKRNHK